MVTTGEVDGAGDDRRPVLVACAHGTRNPAGQEAIAALVDAVGAVEGAPPVRAAYVDVQSPTPTDVLAALTDDEEHRHADTGASALRAVLVPVLLSTGYHVQVDLERAARHTPGVIVADPLGPDPALADLLARRLGSSGAVRDTDDVRLVAAGSSRAEGGAAVEAMADLLGAKLGRVVRPAHLSARAPLLTDVVAEKRRTAGRLVVATYLLAPGHFHDRVSGSGADLETGPLIPSRDEVPTELVELVLRRYDQACRAAAARRRSPTPQR